MRKLILLLSLILPLSLAAQVEYDTVTVVDPEDFTLAVTIDTASLQFFSKKNDVWLRVNPQTLKDWIDLDSVSYYGDTLRIYQGGNPVPFKVEILAGIEDGDYGDIDVSGGGTVWNIDTAVVGPNELAPTAVTPGIYTLATITVDEDGRIISAANGSEVDGDVTNELQTVDSLILQGTTLILALEGDGEAPYTVDLSSLQDGTGTDDQTLSWNGGTGELSIESGNTVDLDGRYLQSEVDGSVTNELQQVDTLVLAGTILGISLSSDGVAQKTVDLSSLQDGTGTDDQNLSVGAGSATTSIIEIEDGTDVTLQAGSNITLSEAGNTITIAASSGTATVGDGDYGDIVVTGTGTVWSIDSGVVGSTEVTDNSLTADDLAVNVISSLDGVTNDGGNIDLIAGGIVTITPDDGANTITISATEVDGSITNEIQQIDTLSLEDGVLTISLSNDGVPAVTVDLSPFLDNTDNQTVDTFSLAGTILTIALENDGEAPYTVDLSSLQDGTGTDDQTLSWNGGTGELSIESGNTVDLDGRYLQTEVDGSVTNEGLLSVGAGGANTSTISSNTSGSNTVTISGGGIVTVTENTGTHTITVSATEVDGSVTNEAWTIDATGGDTEVISNQTVLFAGAGIASTSYSSGTNTLTITATEVDGSVSNEGSLTVGAGTATTSLINSNTAGSTPVTLEAGSNVTLSESGNTITIAAVGDGAGTDDQTLSWNGSTGELSIESGNTVDLDGRYLQSFTEVDGSITNEGSLTVGAGGANSSTIVSNTSGSTPVTISGGSNITITESGSTITIAATAGADNLGNHTATASLNMDGNPIDSVSVLTLDDTDADGGTWNILEKGVTNVGDLWIQHSADSGPTLGIFQDGTIEINDAYTLPNADGFAGYVLKTNGAGVVSWQADETGGAGSADDSYGEAYLSTPDTLAINAGAPVKVDGTTAGDLKDFSHSSGRLTYSGPTAMFLVNYSAEVEGENSGSYAKVWLYRNGAAVNGSQRWEYIETADGKENISTSILTQLDSLDYLEVFHDASDTMDLRIIRAGLNVIKVGSSTTEGAGEVNAGVNLGAGEGVYAGKSGTDLQFKSLTDGGIVSISSSATEVNISATEVDGSVTNEIQQIDTLSLSGTILSLSLSLDGVAAETLDLAALQDGTGTDDQTLSWNGGTGELSIESGNTVDLDGRYLQSEVDGSVSNEGSLTVGAGTSTTSLIQSNTSGSTAVTLEAGANIVLSETGNTITIAASGGGAPGDGDYGDITVSGTGTVWNIDSGVVGSTEVTDNSLTADDLLVNVVSSLDGVTNDGGNIDLVASGIVSITPDDGANTITIGATEVDGSVTNEGSLTVLAGTASDAIIRSNTSGSTDVTIEVAGINTIVETGNTIRITATEVDGSVSNEGSLTVGAGTSTTSLIQSNTSGSTAVTLEAGSNITLSESGNTITIAATGGSADNLGNHSATQDLDMNSYDMIDLDTLQWNYSGAGDTKMFVDQDDVLRIYQGNAYSAASEIISGQAGGGVRIDGAYTLPATDGTNGQVLRTNGSGTVTWQTATADNLGNHTATMTLDMNDNAISDVSGLTFTDGDADGNYFAINENFSTGVWQVQSSNQANPALTVNDAMAVKVSNAYTLPTVAGTNGYVLTTDGSGGTSWAAGGGGGGSPVAITPSTIGSNQNNYAPTGFSTADVVRISASDFYGITGFSSSGVTAWKTKTIVNVGDYPIYITGEHPSSTSTNRVISSQDVIITPGKFVDLAYDNTSSRWRIVNLPGRSSREQNFRNAGGSVTSGDWGDFLISNSGGTTTIKAPDASSPAGFTQSTSTSATGQAIASFLKSVLTLGFFGSSHGYVESEVIFPTLSNGTDSYRYSVAVTATPTSSSTGGVLPNSVGICYTHDVNGGNWSGFAVNNTGSVTYVDLGVGVAANTTYRLRAEINKANSEARFYLDGALLGVISSGMPNAVAYGVRSTIAKTAGTAARVAYLLYLEGGSLYSN